MRRTRNADGFTYIEVSIILLALAILVGILLPSIGNFNALARTIRLKEDLGVLCVSLKLMLDDLGDSAFFSSAYADTSFRSVAYTSSSSAATYDASSYGASGYDTRVEYGVRMEGRDAEWCDNCNMPRADCGRDCMDDCDESCRHDCGDDCRHGATRYASVTTQTQRYDGSQAAIGRTSSYAASASSYGSSGYNAFFGTPVGLLVGEGDIPRSAIGATGWQLGLGTVFTEATHGYYPVGMNFVVDTLGNLLIHQDPTYSRYTASSAVGYGRGGAYGAIDTTFRWRGPYIADRIASDPWGNRYMVNVFGLHAAPVGTYPATIRGAGATRGYVEGFQSAVVCYSAGQNETIETEFNQPFGWYTGGDDVTAVLAGAGGIR